ncbi:WhiB family transcriptional regulator [Streptomyces sp. NPDC057623]|uniref:WhiB family transcriptional regulator n=1 Tax=Streptomyces sp. NPDC057623 TaxID=3346187 RepID=UPI0036BE1EB5
MSASHQHPNSLPNALEWADRAACRGYDLELFFSDAARNVQRAKQICRMCPVREECLAETLRAEDGSRYGISGGLTPEERTELVNGPRTTGRKPAKCGTRSAYQRHVKKKEPIDEACRVAKRESDRRLRTTGTTRP